jgi:ankyrin repeat protein
MSNQETITAFLHAASNGEMETAKKLLAENPALAQADIYTASVLGEADFVGSLLNENPSLATAKGGPRDWPPLLYACFSRFHREGSARAEGIVRTAKLLLAHGADPNTFYEDDRFPDNPLPALYGATGHSNNAALARALLEAGANPNDNESLYHSSEHSDHVCMKLLFEFGIKPEKTNALKRNLDFDDLEGARLLLEYGTDPNEYIPTALHHAVIRGRGGEFVDLLVQHGVNLEARDEKGKTAYELACRYGNNSAAKALARHGANTDLSSTEQFLAACARADEAAVRAIIAEQPNIVSTLGMGDKRVMADMAMFNNVEAVRLMLEIGMDVAAPGDHHATPLHWAGWHGHKETVDVLLKYNPPLEAVDGAYGGTPLGWTGHGSVNCGNSKGDYVGTVKSLLAAGAVIPPGFSGSKEVMEAVGKS